MLVLGDSISAGYGIDVEKGWVNLLKQKLSGDVSVINGSISGDTTEGGLSRLPALLESYQPDYVLIALGGNDGLRGYPLNLVRQNLKSMIELCRNHSAEPILLGMKIPANYGKRYTDEFAGLYPRVARESGTQLVPFSFESFFTQEGMIQSDGIHPTEAAQPIILNKVFEVLEDYIHPSPG